MHLLRLALPQIVQVCHDHYRNVIRCYGNKLIPDFNFGSFSQPPFGFPVFSDVSGFVISSYGTTSADDLWQYTTSRLPSVISRICPRLASTTWAPCVADALNRALWGGVGGKILAESGSVLLPSWDLGSVEAHRRAERDIIHRQTAIFKAEL